MRKQVGGTHYEDMAEGQQPLERAKAREKHEGEHERTLLASAEKYLFRYRDKCAPIKDLKKCIWYIEAMIEDIEGWDKKRLEKK